MQKQLKIALIVIVLVYLFCILKAVKKKKMRINYLIFWTITGVILIFSLIIPNLVDSVSNLIGFEMPINMIFSIAIFVILYLIFDLTVQISNEEVKNTILTQEISMLKARVEKLEKDKKEE